MQWIREIWKVTGRYRRSWLLGALAQTLGELLFLALLHQLIERLVEGHSRFWMSWSVWFLTSVGAVVLRSVGFFVHQKSHREARLFYQHFLLRRTLGWGLRLEQWLAQGRTSTEFYQRVNDLNSRLVAGLQFLPVFMQALFLLLGVLPFLFWLAPGLTLILLGVYLPLMVFLNQKMKSLTGSLQTPMTWSRRAAVRETQYYRFRETVHSAFLREAALTSLTKSYEEKWQSERRYHTAEVKVSVWAEAMTSLWIVLSLALAAGYIEGDHGLASSLLTFCSALVFLYKPLREAGKYLPAVHEARSCFNDLLAFAQMDESYRPYLVFDRENTIELCAVCTGYADHPVLNELSYRVNVDEPLWISGKNGAGKSTMFKLLVGRGDLWSGEVHWPVGWGAEDLFYLGQNPHLPVISRDLFDGESSEYENLRRDLKLNSIWKTYLNGEESEKQIVFSGGEQQRLSVFLALWCKPKALLLDEPFSGVPQAERLQLLEKVKDFCRVHGIVFWVISHDELKGFKHWPLT